MRKLEKGEEQRAPDGRTASRPVLQTFSWRGSLSLLSGYQESAGHVACLVLLCSHVIHFAVFKHLRVRCYTCVILPCMLACRVWGTQKAELKSVWRRFSDSKEEKGKNKVSLSGIESVKACRQRAVECCLGFAPHSVAALLWTYGERLRHGISVLEALPLHCAQSGSSCALCVYACLCESGAHVTQQSFSSRYVRV